VLFSPNFGVPRDRDIPSTLIHAGEKEERSEETGEEKKRREAQIRWWKTGLLHFGTDEENLVKLTVATLFGFIVSETSP
jgi:hypothetical protein